MTMRTDSKQGIPEPGLEAAREGRVIWGYVNEKTGIDTTAALTDSDFIQNIEVDKRYVITQAYMHLSTDSDSVEVAFGVTEQANGAGGFTAKTAQYRLETGTQTSEAQPSFLNFNPPLVVTKDDGDCFTAQVTGNDASAALTLEYRGLKEDDV